MPTPNPTTRATTRTAATKGADGRVLRARERREERRHQLLAVGRQLFAERGYHGTSVGDLLEAAGVARGTLYQHFKGKRALFDALLDDFVARLRDAIVPVDIAGPEPPMQQLHGNVKRVVGLLADNRDLARLLLHTAEGLDEDVDRKLREFYDHALAMIEGSLRTGMRLGLVREGPIRLRAIFVLGTLREVVEHALLRDPVQLDRADDELPSADEITVAVIDYATLGLLARR